MDFCTTHVCLSCLSEGSVGWLKVCLSSATPPCVQARPAALQVKGGPRDSTLPHLTGWGSPSS